MLLERIRNCRYYWQLNYFELLRLYLTCTHTPLDSAPSKPLRPQSYLIIMGEQYNYNYEILGGFSCEENTVYEGSY